jgi:hypothetical protein
MNTIHNNGENDNSLNDGLGKVDHAYGQLPHEEPPELLDQAILNSAHRAVERKPHWMKFGWLHGLTTTAVFVLALSLIFNQREQVPDFDDRMRTSESAGLQREKVAKKQSRDIQSDQRMELKEENEVRQDALKSAPVPVALPSEAVEITVGDQGMKPASAGRRSMYSQDSLDSLDAKKDSTDDDASGNAPVLEESLMDEADLIADTPELEVIAREFRPAAVAAPALSKISTSVEIDSEIEQKLLTIIQLKQSGDEAWIIELEKFKQDYPDYPLPEDLSK